MEAKLRGKLQRSWSLCRAHSLPLRAVGRIWACIIEYPLCAFALIALAGYQLVALVMLLVYVNTNRTIEYHDSQERMRTETHGVHKGDAALRNAPCPVGFIVNSRGRKLYYRVLMPEAREAKCVLLLIHGYAAHFQRPLYIAYLQMLLAKGIAVATLDLEGHGYSEGLRCYVEDYVLMVEDIEQFVELITNGKAHVTQMTSPPASPIARPTQPATTASSSSSSAAASAGSGGPPAGPSVGFLEMSLPDSEGKAIARLPLFVGGQSMGGGLALLTSHRVAARCDTFRGCVLLCPALANNPSPRSAQGVLVRFVLASLFPQSIMPSFLDGTTDLLAIWKRKGMVQWQLDHDTWGKPGGLGWGPAMRWGTAASLLGMIECIGTVMEEVDVPLLLLHDPNDKVVSFDGSKELLERAPSRHKRYVMMHGSLHDQMCNSPEELTETIDEWVRERLPRYPETHKSA
jgi:alpha-beta hydrolase superfamily lysophospholipase